jgi:hypothetical protein
MMQLMTRTKRQAHIALFRRRNGSRSVRNPRTMAPLREPRPVKRDTRARVRPLKSTAVMAPWYA